MIKFLSFSNSLMGLNSGIKEKAWVLLQKIRGKPLMPEYISKDKKFIELYNQIKGCALLGAERAHMIYQFARHSLNIPGDAAEVGVYKGGSAKIIASVFGNSSKKIHLFDTFEGTPEIDPAKDNNNFLRKGMYDDVDFDSVKNFLAEFKNVRIYKGIFPKTANAIKKSRFCFVHIDVNTYRSTKDCLEFFYPKMNKGGIILLDDYKSKECRGVQKAADQFFKGRKECIIQTTSHQCAIIKI